MKGLNLTTVRSKTISAYKRNFLHMLVICSFMLIGSCAHFSTWMDDVAYEKTTKKNTISAYEKYLENYPVGSHSEEARLQIAILMDTIERYEKFLVTCSVEPSCVTARNRLEEKIFERASQTDTIQAYEKYLAGCSKGRYSCKFREKALFGIAVLKNTTEAYRKFLKICTLGDLCAVVRDKLEEKVFENAINSNTIETFSDYMAEYPEGRHKQYAHFHIAMLSDAVDMLVKFLESCKTEKLCEQAKSKLDDKRYEQAIRINTMEAWAHFINQNPKSQYLQQAYFNKARLSDTLADYIEFLDQFPDTENRAEIERRIYSTAKTIKSIDNVKEFMLFYDRNKPQHISAKNVRTVISNLERWSAINRSVAGYIVLFKRTQNEKYLKNALNYRQLVEDPYDELFLVKRHPNVFLVLSDWDHQDEPLLVEKDGWIKDTENSTYEYTFRVKSKAKLVKLKSTVRVQIPIEVIEKGSGMSFKKPKKYPDSIEKDIELTCMPGCDYTRKLKVSFYQKIVVKQLIKKKITVKDLSGTPTYDFIKLRLITP